MIEVMDDYFLTKEDWDALVEMGVGKKFQEEAVLKLIPTAVKAAFTRKCVDDVLFLIYLARLVADRRHYDNYPRRFNKMTHPIPFYKSTDGKVVKKLAGGPAPDQEDVLVSLALPTPLPPSIAVIDGSSRDRTRSSRTTMGCRTTVAPRRGTTMRTIMGYRRTN